MPHLLIPLKYFRICLNNKQKTYTHLFIKFPQKFLFQKAVYSGFGTVFCSEIRQQQSNLIFLFFNEMFWPERSEKATYSLGHYLTKTWPKIQISREVAATASHKYQWQSHASHERLITASVRLSVRYLHCECECEISHTATRDWLFNCNLGRAIL